MPETTERTSPMTEPNKAARAARNRLFSNLCHCGEKPGYAKSGALCMICTAQEIQRAIDSAVAAERERLKVAICDALRSGFAFHSYAGPSAAAMVDEVFRALPQVPDDHGAGKAAKEGDVR